MVISQHLRLSKKIKTVRDKILHISMATVLSVTSLGSGMSLLIPGQAAATTNAMDHIAFTTSPQSVTAGVVSNTITIQTQNNGNQSTNLDTSNNTLSVTSTSGTGEFAESAVGPWAMLGSFSMASGTANKNFVYRDTTPGTYTLTATLSANGGAKVRSTTQQITINAAAPVVSSVTVPANNTYGLAENLDFVVNFDQNVTVNTAGGTPSLAVTIGGSTVAATYLSGSGSSALTFRYTVQPGDNDDDGITVGLLSLNGGTIQNTSAVNATLTLNSIGSTTSVLVDTTNPTVAADALSTSDTTPTLTGTISEATSSLDVTVNGHTYAATNNDDGTWTVDVTDVLSNGTYNVTVEATDLAGNNGDNSAQAADQPLLTIDTNAPYVNFVNPDNGDTVRGNIWVSSYAYDAHLTSYSLSIDGDSPVQTSTHNGWHFYYLHTSTLSDGWHALTITATDTAGNTTSITHNVLVDNTDPEVHIYQPDQYDYLSGDVKVRGSAYDATSGLDHHRVIVSIRKLYGSYCSLIPVQVLTAHVHHGHWKTSFDSTGLDDGRYCITVLARDNAGNLAFDTVNYVTIDNTAPKAGFTAPTPDDNSTVNTDFTVGFWLHDNAALRSVRVNLFDSEGEWVQNCYHNHHLHSHHFWTTCDVTLGDLADGAYTLKLRVKDQAGNSYEVTRTINIDRTAPVITVDSQSTLNTHPTITGTVDNPTATVTIQIDGGADLSATNNGDGTWSYAVPTALSVGTHTVTATATDTVGNVSAVANGTVTIKTLPVNNDTDSDNTPTTPVSETNTTPQVLGTSTDTTADSTTKDTGSVKSDKTTKDDSDDTKKSGNFLGLGWWWILLLAIAAMLWWLIAARRRKDDEEEN